MLYINVFDSFVVNEILDQRKASITVAEIIVTSCCGKPSSCKSFLNHIATLVVEEATMYSVSVDESAIVGCFLFVQLTALFVSRKAKPIVHL